MFFTERIVLFTCLYTALIYAIFYLFFEAYPLIFQSSRFENITSYNLAPGPASLTFLPIGTGSLLSFPVFVAYDALLRRTQRLDSPWARRYEARRLPLAFLGGPLISMSIFWLSWTAMPDSIPSPVVPALAGLPYGIGFVLIFMSLLNYLTDAYDIYAASALAAASCTRSLCGALLPLAAGAMYGKLGVQWAGTLLGGLSVLCLGVPVGFLFWGEKLRAGSRFAGEVEERRKREREEQDGEDRRKSREAGSSTEKDV